VELEMQLWSPGMQAYTGSKGGSFLPQKPRIRRNSNIGGDEEDAGILG
jgi:hypothetical protein